MSIQANFQPRTRLDALSYATRLWEVIDTPISLGCALRLKYAEYEQLVGMSVDPLNYLDAHGFFCDYQSVKLLSKYPYLDTKIDTEKVALAKFYASEEQCRLTNARFRFRESGHPFDDRVERILSNAQRKISSILGDVPSLDRLEFSFGPGAAFGVRKETSVFNKVTATLECTYAFTPIVQEFMEEFPGWFPEGETFNVNLVNGSELTFVPKDATTDRPICIEPLLNGLYQKGFGTYIRGRLRKHGINLNDQTINQKLAASAHVSGLSTVDFSSASDTISYLLVQDLLPFDWFQALDVARCPRFLIKDVGWQNFQKFSSMGNAYTFELESLIFYALAYACAEEEGIKVRTGVNLSVYGDDVIIPREVFDLFSEVTVICGFSFNLRKSFKTGVFFESCGTDYFMGIPVRPFLLKKRINALLPSFYAINTINRLIGRLPKESPRLPYPKGKGRSRSATLGVDHYANVVGGLRHLHGWCVQCVPVRFRLMGPEGYGDGHIIADFDESRPARHPYWDAWCFRSYAERPALVKRVDWPTAYALYFTRVQRSAQFVLEEIPSPTDNGLGYAVRGRTRITLQKVFCHGAWPLTPKGAVHTAFA